MRHIKTKSGFEVDIDESVVDNMEFVDILTEIDDESTPAPFGLSRICSMVLGKKNKKALYEHLRDEHGNVPPDKVEAELMEIILGLGKEAKN